MRRRHRLTARRLFADIRAARIAAACGDLRIQAAPNGGLPMRAAFAITGVRLAVTRNRVRRRLRALLHERLAELRGVDLVIRAGVAAARAPSAVLSADLDGCLTRVVPRVRAVRSPSVADSEAPVAENETSALT